jgi:GINS complex protein
MQASEIASFRADDSIVDIIADFDLPIPLYLSSSIPVGPFKAGISTKVPLWMAVVLEQRSLARISPPPWLSVESLTSVIAYERREASLFHDETKLPLNYYELSKRILVTNNNNDAVALLVQDLLDIRLDKLRQQFQTLIHERTMEASGRDDDIIIEVNGIGTRELAILHDFVTQALSDKSFLEEVVPSENATATNATSTTTTTESDKRQAVLRSKAPLRKFRTGRN